MHKLEKMILEQTMGIFDNYEQLTALELIRKIIEKINEVIQETNDYTVIVKELRTWFEKLDIYNEVSDKLDDMTEDGTLEELINVLLFEGLKTDIEAKALKTFINLSEVKGDTFDDKLENAISEVSEGGMIFIPKGVYKNTRELTINKSIRISGDYGTFWGKGTIIYSTSPTNVFLINTQAVQLERLYIQSENITPIAGTVGVKLDVLTHISNCSFNHVYIKGFEKGFEIYRGYFVDLRYCRAGNCIYGFYLRTESTTLTLYKCWSILNTNGYYLSSVQYSELINCACDQCDNPYIIENCKALTLKGGGIEVSRNIPIVATDSTLSIEGYESYNNNDNLQGLTSFGKFTNCYVTLLGNYEYTIKGNQYTFDFYNTIATIIGGCYRKENKADSTSQLIGAMSKDGGVIHYSDNSGENATLDSLFTGGIFQKRENRVVTLHIDIRTTTNLGVNNNYIPTTIGNLYKPINKSVSVETFLNGYRCKITIETTGVVTITPKEEIPSGAYLDSTITFVR